MRELLFHQSAGDNPAHFGYAAESLFLNLFEVILERLGVRPRAGGQSLPGPDIEVRLPGGKTLLCEVKVSPLSGRIPPSRYAAFLDQVEVWNQKYSSPKWMLVTNHSLNPRMLQRLDDHHVVLFTFDMEETYLDVRRKLEDLLVSIIEQR